MNSDFFTNLDPDVYKTIVFIFVLVLIMRFLLSIVKRLLDHKLKNKIIDSGLSQDLSDSLLQTDEISETSNNIKYFLIFLSTGIGLLLSSIILPIGIHSIAIIVICISLGFLAYSVYLKSNLK